MSEKIDNNGIEFDESQYFHELTEKIDKLIDEVF